MNTTSWVPSWSRLALILGVAASVVGSAAAGAGAPGEDGSAPGRSVGTPQAKADALAVARLIDEAVELRLAERKAAPAPAADDAEFLRRVYLDLTGVIPPAARVSAFLGDRDPDKRAAVIDDLLASPRYGLAMADRWENLLMVRDSSNRLLKSRPLIDWLAKRFNDNAPWTVLVNDLLTATGTQEENGASTFFIALRTPDKLNDQVCRLFLGVRLQCAQCHDHPFAAWKRDDYWGMAAFFSKVRAGGKKVGLPKNAAESVNEAGLGKKAPKPDSALDVLPKFLGGARPEVPAGAPLRPVLAKWVTSPDNPFFARAVVNRTWAQLFGRGLVNPVDDAGDAAAAKQPELFAALTRRFAAGGYDLKALIRGVCNSRAYQRASAPTDGSAEDEPAPAGMAVKPMSPEQLYDSLTAVLGTPEEPRDASRKAAKKAGAVSPRDRFVVFFQAPEGSDPTEYATGIPQVLRLLNSPETNKGGALLDTLVAPGVSPETALERLYLTTLSRRPTPAEVARLTAYLKGAGGTAREGYADVLWVLLNSAEFALIH